MPEAVTKMERTVPTLTIDTGDSVETLGLPAEEKWGFRLTGGSDFGMPVTVFQVKEGSRAEIVGVKCGDSILRINGITTAGMSLKDAQQALEYAGDDLRLQVASFQDDDNDSPPKDVRDIVLAEPIDRQLRNMQKKLLAIANIPLVIQHAIEEVARVLEKFVPPEPEVEEPDSDESDYAVTVESLFDESEVLETISQYDYEEEDVEEEEDEIDIEIELTAEERDRLERMKNIKTVQKSWPWKDEERPIHKNCYLVPSSHELIEKRKKQLNKFLIPPFYKPPIGANTTAP